MNNLPVTYNDHIHIAICWAMRREVVRLKKDCLNLPKPWTEDPLLQQYRFCNVDRIHDKETVKLFHWYMEHQHLGSLWFNVCIARWINWSPTVEALGWTDVSQGYDANELFERFNKIESDKLFTGAYMIRGATRNEFPKTPEGEAEFERCKNKRYFLAHHVFKGIYGIGAPEEGETLESYHSRLTKAKSNGDFMAGQQIADLKYFTMRGASDWQTWAPIGPGPTRFLNRAHGRELTTQINKTQYYVEINQVIDDVRKVAEEYVTFDMVEEQAKKEVIKSLSDAHNAGSNLLCETDKYIRLMEGGQVRSKYDGVGSTKKVEKKQQTTSLLDF